MASVNLATLKDTLTSNGLAFRFHGNSLYIWPQGTMTRFFDHRLSHLHFTVSFETIGDGNSEEDIIVTIEHGGGLTFRNVSGATNNNTNTFYFQQGGYCDQTFGECERLLDAWRRVCSQWVTPQRWEDRPAREGEVRLYEEDWRHLLEMMDEVRDILGISFGAERSDL